MTRAEDVDAAIERAQDDIGRHFSPKYQAHADRALLAEEVVRLRKEANQWHVLYTQADQEAARLNAELAPYREREEFEADAREGFYSAHESIEQGAT